MNIINFINENNDKIKEISITGLDDIHEVLNIPEIARSSLELYSRQDENAIGIKIKKSQTFLTTIFDSNIEIDLDLLDLGYFDVVDNILVNDSSSDFFIIECSDDECSKINNTMFIINPKNTYKLCMKNSFASKDIKVEMDVFLLNNI